MRRNLTLKLERFCSAPPKRWKCDSTGLVSCYVPRWKRPFLQGSHAVEKGLANIWKKFEGTSRVWRIMSSVKHKNYENCKKPRRNRSHRLHLECPAARDCSRREKGR